MTVFAQTPELASTPFSEFIRNASAREKKRVYMRVLKRANARQQRLLAEWKRVAKPVVDSKTTP